MMHKGEYLIRSKFVFTPETIQEKGEELGCQKLSWSLTAQALREHIQQPFGILHRGRLHVYRTTDWGYRTVNKLSRYRVVHPMRTNHPAGLHVS